MLRQLRRLFRRHEPRAAQVATSFVLLLREPHELSETTLSLAAERAWDAGFANPDSGNYVVREEQLCLIKFSGDLFHLLQSAQPYGTSPERAADSIPELRRRKAWSDHNAWISVSCVGGGQGSGQQKLHLIGRLVAELVNSNCTGIYFPAQNYVIPNENSLADRLRAFISPEELVYSASPPVPLVEDDDPRMAQAIAEARSKWPQFAEAFRKRPRGVEFFVKAKFTDGSNAEWMWVEVATIESEHVAGSLQNSPVQLRNIALGDGVRVPIAEIGDWLYIADGRTHGGFSRAAFE